MKKLLLSLFICFGVILSVYAENLPNLKYKNIAKKDKISYDSENATWSTKINRKDENYYTKTKGFGSFYDYLDSQKNFAFSTNCEYEFIYNGRFIGYSSRDMKFYDMAFIDGELLKQELSKEEVEEMFPDYKIISISDFSAKTNSIKVKKHFGTLNIILYNDSDKTFDDYKFSSGNAKFEQYDISGFLSVSKPGMIQFSRDGEKDSKLWYIILVR